MIALSSITGIIIFIIVAVRIAIGSNEPEKVITTNEREYDLMVYNPISGNYTVNK